MTSSRGEEKVNECLSDPTPLQFRDLPDSGF